MNYLLEPFKKYADFKGRARRKEFWIYVITIGIIGGILKSFSPMLETVFSLVTCLPSITVGVRRMHDVGKSGWFSIIPLYNIYLACLDSEEGPNRFGENPKEMD